MTHLYQAVCIKTNKDRNSECFLLSVCQLEGKVQQGERDFEQISKTIRKEVSRFEVRVGHGFIFKSNAFCSVSLNSFMFFLQKERVKDFKMIIVKYLESLVQTQQQVKHFILNLSYTFHCSRVKVTKKKLVFVWNIFLWKMFELANFYYS